MICRVRVFVYERWALDKILPGVLIQVDQWHAVRYSKTSPAGHTYQVHHKIIR